MEELEKNLPEGGILAVPHGAGVNVVYRDLDGFWISELRNRVGNKIPIAGTLDLYADVEEMGTSIIVVTDVRSKLALEVARDLSDFIVDREQFFVGSLLDARAAVNKLGRSETPALLLDMKDNIGGGSHTFNRCLLAALEQKDNNHYFICIYDPASVQENMNYKNIDYISIDFNGTIGVDQVTYPIEVKLEKIIDENFQEVTPRLEGQVNYKLGRTAILKIRNGSVILLASKRTPPYCL